MHGDQALEDLENDMLPFALWQSSPHVLLEITM